MKWMNTLICVNGGFVLMKTRIVILKCPKCECGFHYNNYWQWILHSPMHWFGRRYTQCPWCSKKSWMKREK